MESLQSYIKNNTTAEVFESLTFVDDILITSKEVAAEVQELLKSYVKKHNTLQLPAQLHFKDDVIAFNKKTWNK